MKKICFFLFLLPLFTACDKQLQEDPKNKITADNFYSNDNEAILGVNGVYSWLNTSGGFKSSLWRALDEGTDQFRSRKRASDPEQNYTLSSFSPGYTQAVWTNLYKGISNANLVIDKVGTSTGVSEATKRRVLAEAKFLRSLYYYYLTGLFGDAVYYDETNYSIVATQLLSRVPAEDIRKNILVSLKEAEAVLPAKFTGADVGRVTKGAVQTLMVKTMLWLKQWDDAQKKAQEIITAKTYTLQANYADIFTEANEMTGSEIIFEVDFEPVLNGQDHHCWYQPEKQVGVQPFSGRSWYGTYVPYTTFLNYIEANDKRRASIVATSYNNQNFQVDPVEKITTWSGPKFWRLATSADADGGLDMYVFRYADVWLMLAEAANENNDPATALLAVNEIRKRSFGATGVFNANLSKADMTEYLFKERAVEFYGEGQRRLDLIRWGKLVSSVKTAAITEDPYVAGNIQSFHDLYPIAAVEIQKNPNLEPNNTGY